MPTVATTIVTRMPPQSAVGMSIRPRRGAAAQEYSRTKPAARRKNKRRQGRGAAPTARRASRCRMPAPRKNTSTRQRSNDRIKAVDEIRKPDAHERPAGAGLGNCRRSQASLAVVPRPHRIEQKEPQQGRHRPGDEKNADKRQRDIAWRRKQIVPQPADHAGPLRRRRQPFRRHGAQVVPLRHCRHRRQRSSTAIAYP